MMKPLLTIGLMHGSLNGDVAKVRISVGAKTIGQCYVSTAELMKCLAGQATPCALTYEEAEKELRGRSVKAGE